MKEAIFYEKLEEKKVKCTLCPHQCIIHSGKRGICGVRENREGKLFSLVYEKVISWAVDPIEKKPLYHFLPGEAVFSFATVGCNFRCLNCQNYTISQISRQNGEIPGERIPPEKIVQLTRKSRAKIIAYTYTEPTIFYEYAYDTCRLAHEQGIKNVFVTNGYIMPQPLKEISPFLDAANVDLKSMKETFYQKICGGKLKPVLDSIKLMRKLGIWVEVTTLVIPGMNDEEEEFESIARFLLQLGNDIPWHISRFYPAYKMTRPSYTPIEALHRAREVGKNAGLKYVYIGNVPGEESENTFCPNCGKIIVKRKGFWIEKIDVEKGRCRWCHNKIEGVWE
ncbi:AmmeMemoRadiSam system radical SAM enzyme [Candidatus Aerophobetes bacterium]|uniref:AmmeMemoRadiSam system radical SAM enzyme n=1 Tax=Aerophobetes bacterium TaxID=2030807 RepID=A0A662DAP4_UNCAE|nr:MAG: AmmeMemoRadiSam system radical SAM enzyme [Candidatus Aerophobetes bacterium]